MGGSRRRVSLFGDAGLQRKGRGCGLVVVGQNTGHLKRMLLAMSGGAETHQGKLWE